jgi:hypothetical protein
VQSLVAQLEDTSKARDCYRDQASLCVKFIFLTSEQNSESIINVEDINYIIWMRSGSSKRIRNQRFFRAVSSQNL